MPQNPVTLYHIDPIRNMQRFYRLDIQPDLFGNHCLIREWGRIGQAGQMQMTSYRTEEEAQVNFCKQQKTKESKGYAA